MRSYLIGLTLLLALPGLGRAEDDAELRKRVVGTWENVSGAHVGREYRQVKLVTATHFTWVMYGLETREVTSAAGGTWTIRDGLYREKIEFATEVVAHLRGKEYGFRIAIEGDSWEHRLSGGEEIVVAETWKRVR